MQKSTGLEGMITAPFKACLWSLVDGDGKFADDWTIKDDLNVIVSVIGVLVNHPKN